VIEDVKLGMGVILHVSANDLCTSLSDRITATESIQRAVTFAFVLHFRTFLKEYFTQDFFFFRVRVVIFDVVVVGLVKDACSIVVAIWIFVSVTPHLVDYLRLSWLRP